MSVIYLWLTFDKLFITFNYMYNNNNNKKKKSIRTEDNYNHIKSPSAYLS